MFMLFALGTSKSLLLEFNFDLYIITTYLTIESTPLSTIFQLP